MEFNFNKKTEDSNKLDELKTTNDVEAKVDDVELIDNASKEAEDNKETDRPTKAVVTYIGNGTWKDSNDKCWARVDGKNVLSTRSFNIDDYENRDDLKFMVRYGEMKVSFV